MSTTRSIEVFSAGCPVCDQAVAAVTRIACPSCAVEVVSMRDEAGAERARRYGITRVPAVVVDGRLAACCGGSAPNEAILRAMGVGSPLA